MNQPLLVAIVLHTVVPFGPFCEVFLAAILHNLSFLFLRFEGAELGLYCG